MDNNFIITAITHVIFVGNEDYLDKTVSFTGNPLHHNELILHLSGKCRVNFNNTIFDCEENTVRFLPKGKNDVYTVENIEKGECIDVFFDTNNEISAHAFCVKMKNNEKIVTLFKKIFSAWVSKKEGGYFESLSILYNIFAEMQKSSYICDNQYKKIEPAVKYIHKNFLTDKISVPYLAKICGISETYLKKLFVKHFSVPPSKYVIRMKINHACDILSSERFSVSETADFCGYNDTAFFSRQFKEYVGISPNKYKEKYKSSK